MEAKQISEVINQGLQKQELQPLKSGDERFVACLGSKKIKDCSLEDLKQPLRLAMLKVGIREQNIPQGEEKNLLISHILTNFGGNHIDEIVMAFEMAIAGKLDIDEKEVNAYENFSCLYISRIMNSYRRWAIQEFRQHEKVLAPGMKLLPKSEQPKTWGMFIENEYRHFLSFGEEKMKLWPAEFYDQLVADGFISKDFFRSLMPGVREKMISELRQERYKHQSGTLNGLNKSRKEFAQSIMQTNLSHVDDKISDYITGKKDPEIELAAKQHSVLKLFIQAKDKFKEHIYKPF